jgi:hypothetical protein
VAGSRPGSALLSPYGAPDELASQPLLREAEAIAMSRALLPPLRKARRLDLADLYFASLAE